MSTNIQWLLLLMALSTGAFAHEPFEITVMARVASEGVTLRALIADTTAAKLCLPATAARPTLHERELADYRHEVEVCAKELFIVSDGDRTLMPSSVHFHLTDEKDLEVTLTYPVDRSGVLRIEAIHLKKLDRSIYGDMFSATTDNKFLVQKLLQLDDEPWVDVPIDRAALTERTVYQRLAALPIERGILGLVLVILLGLLHFEIKGMAIHLYHSVLKASHSLRLFQRIRNLFSK